MWFGNVTAGDTIQIPWDVVSLASGSVTPTTAGSIRIYKGSSTTERSSASGITDTRTFDSVTGQNIVVIDLSDNTDAGFYAAGNNYHVMLVGAVVEGLTINKWLASFSIQNRNDYADIREIGGSAVSTSSAQLGVNVVQAGATAWGSGAITAASIAAAALDGKGDWNVGKTGYSLTATTGLGNQTADITGNLSGSVGSVVGLTASNLDTTISSRLASASYTAPDNASIAAILVDTAEIGAAGAGLTALASAADLATVAGYVDTEVAAIKAKTDLIPGTQDGLTFAQTVLLMGSALLGKASGAATTTVTFRALDDSKDRVTATVDADGNRSAVTLDAA